MQTLKNAASIRRMTICSKTFDRLTGRCARVPILSLCGKWLGESGFEIGHTVDITCEQGRLTITLSAEQRYLHIPNGRRHEKVKIS